MSPRRRACAAGPPARVVRGRQLSYAHPVQRLTIEAALNV